jgi:hypothetical protein
MVFVPSIGGIDPHWVQVTKDEDLARGVKNYGAFGEEQAPSSRDQRQKERQMPQQNDLSRSLISFEQATALVAVIKLSRTR